MIFDTSHWHQLVHHHRQPMKLYILTIPRKNWPNSSMPHILSPHLEHSSKQLKTGHLTIWSVLTDDLISKHLPLYTSTTKGHLNLKTFSPPQSLKLMLHYQIPIQNPNKSWVLLMMSSWQWSQKKKAWHTQIFQVATPSSQNTEISKYLSVMIMTATPF